MKNQTLRCCLLKDVAKKVFLENSSMKNIYMPARHIQKRNVARGRKLLPATELELKLTIATLANSASSVGLTISIGSTRVVVTWVQGTADEQIKTQNIKD
jgi:hypothetical protein